MAVHGNGILELIHNLWLWRNSKSRKIASLKRKKRRVEQEYALAVGFLRALGDDKVVEYETSAAIVVDLQNGRVDASLAASGSN